MLDFRHHPFLEERMFRNPGHLSVLLLLSSLQACGGDDPTVPAAAADPCDEPALLALGQSTSGVLATGDCIVDGGLTDIYSLVLATPATVVIDLSSAAFDAYLEIRNTSGSVIASGDDTEDTDARIVQSLAAGSYRVHATSYFEGESGGYLLSIGEAPDCSPLGAISSGETVDGAIAADDCLLALGGRWDNWALTLSDTATLRVRVESADFDAGLGVFDSGDLVAYFDTYSPTGLATADIFFDPGAWTLAAGTRNETTTGAYSLSVTPTPDCEPGTDVGVGDVASGTVDVDDCYLFGYLPADSYSLVLTEETEVRITQTSPDLAPYFVVGDSAGDIAAIGDGQGSDSASSAVVFTPGRWAVLVSSTGTYAIGSYELRLTAGTCPTATPIALGQILAGVLEAGDCLRPGWALQDAFTLTVPADTTVRIELDAPNFDAWLILKDSVGNVLEENDDGGGSTNSLIERRLPAGAYRIGASTFGGAEGGIYTLRVLLPAAPATAGGLANDGPTWTTKSTPETFGVGTSVRRPFFTAPVSRSSGKPPRRTGS